MVDFNEYWDEPSGAVDGGRLLADAFPAAAERLASAFEDNALGRTPTELVRGARVDEDTARGVFALGEELFEFYKEYIVGGGALSASMLGHMGVIHRDHPEGRKERLVGMLSSLVFLRERAPLPDMLESYLETALMAIYPPAAGATVAKVMKQLYGGKRLRGPRELIAVLDERKVRYVGDETRLALKRAISLLDATPLGWAFVGSGRA